MGKVITGKCQSKENCFSYINIRKNTIMACFSINKGDFYKMIICAIHQQYIIIISFYASSSITNLNLYKLKSNRIIRHRHLH